MEQLTIGTIPWMTAYGLTDLLCQFKLNYQGTLSIHCQEEADSSILKNRVDNGSCDVAFLLCPKSSEANYQKELQASLRLAQDQLVAVLPLQHPLAQEEQVSLADFAEDRILLQKNGALSHQVNDLPNQDIFTSSSLETLMEMVKKGYGVSFLTGQQAKEVNQNSEIQLVPIFPQIDTELLVYYPEQITEPVIKQFISHIQQGMK